jgi:hypothetical protein
LGGHLGALPHDHGVHLAAVATPTRSATFTALTYGLLGCAMLVGLSTRIPTTAQA